MSDDFDREEKAFRDAFRQELEGEAFRPLDADEIKAAAGPVRRFSGPWAKGLVAAAAVVLVVGGAGVVLPRLFGGAGTVASGSMAAAPDESGGITEKDMAGAGAASNAQEGSGVAPGDWVGTAASPLSPRLSASGAWADGRFYVVGGKGLKAGCSGTVAACARHTNNLVDGASYDPASDSWRLLPDAPMAFSEEPPVVVGTRIYYGGSSLAADPPALAVFDTTTGTWARIASPKSGGTLVAAGDRLVNVALTSSAPDQVFDPDSGTWSDLPADLWSDGRVRSGTWADGLLVVASRASGVSSPTRLESLDLASGTWRELPAGEVASTPVVRTVGSYLLLDSPAMVMTSDAVGGRIDLSTGAWLEWSAPPGVATVLSGVGPTVVGDRLLVLSQFYDPADDSWATITLPGSRDLLMPAVAGSPHGMLVFGGADGDTLSSDAYYLPVS